MVAVKLAISTICRFLRIRVYASAKRHTDTFGPPTRKPAGESQNQSNPIIGREPAPSNLSEGRRTTGVISLSY